MYFIIFSSVFYFSTLCLTFLLPLKTFFLSSCKIFLIFLIIHYIFLWIIRPFSNYIKLLSYLYCQYVHISWPLKVASIMLPNVSECTERRGIREEVSITTLASIIHVFPRSRKYCVKYYQTMSQLPYRSTGNKME